MREQLVAAAAEDVASGVAWKDQGGPNQRVWQLINRGAAFCDLVAHPLIISLMGALLDGHKPYYPDDHTLPNFLLSATSGNIAGPGGQAMSLHRDQFEFPTPWPDYPLVANVVWMLDDFTAENGATLVVPGSHLKESRDSGRGPVHAIPAEGKAGTALVFDGRTLHGTGANTTGDNRHGILAYYCRPWLRQQENHCLSVRPDVLAAASAPLRRLLGFDRYNSLGMVNGLPPSLARVGAAT